MTDEIKNFKVTDLSAKQPLKNPQSSKDIDESNSVFNDDEREISHEEMGDYFFSEERMQEIRRNAQERGIHILSANNIDQSDEITDQDRNIYVNTDGSKMTDDEIKRAKEIARKEKEKNQGRIILDAANGDFYSQYSGLDKTNTDAVKSLFAKFNIDEVNSKNEDAGSIPDIKNKFDGLKNMNVASGEEADNIAKLFGVEDGKNGIKKITPENKIDYWQKTDDEGGTTYFKAFKGDDGKVAFGRTHVNSLGEVNYSLVNSKITVENSVENPAVQTSNAVNSTNYKPEYEDKIKKIVSSPTGTRQLFSDLNHYLNDSHVQNREYLNKRAELQKIVGENANSFKSSQYLYSPYNVLKYDNGDRIIFNQKSYNASVDSVTVLKQNGDIEKYDSNGKFIEKGKDNYIASLRDKSNKQGKTLSEKEFSDAFRVIAQYGLSFEEAFGDNYLSSESKNQWNHSIHLKDGTEISFGSGRSDNGKYKVKMPDGSTLQYKRRQYSEF